MSKELIERLRAGTTGDDGLTSELMAEAADRIESLDIERATMAHGYRIASQKCVDLELALAEQRSIAFAAQKEASRCAELERDLQRKESTINTISNALRYAESECARHRSKAGELENENRRLQLDLEDARANS